VARSIGRGWPALGAIVVVAAVALFGVSVVAWGKTGAGAQTFHVSVDGNAKGANESFVGYFPNVVQVHPGDSVEFDWHGPGEPHTVTLGTLVDNVVNAFDKLTPAQLHAPSPPRSLIALDAKLPQLLPQGPGDAAQDAANPCFVTTGVPPAKGGCPAGATAQPAFDGKAAYYNSGWKDPGHGFTVKVASGTASGTYRFICLLHREGMTGTLEVAPTGTPVPSPSAQAARGAKELAAVQGKLAPALQQLRKGQILPFKLPAGTSVLAGSGSPAAQEAGISEFGPRTVHIPVGGSVTWWLLGAHTITFNANSSDDDIRRVAGDGTVHLNPKAAAPASSPGEPHRQIKGGSAAHPKFVVVASKSWNGSGFLSSGVFTNSFGPPLIEGYKLIFSRAGTYHYLCTVHDKMKGTVVVG
jgi:plastocyanin